MSTLEVVIAGGGISGLSAAYFVRERCLRAGRPFHLVLCEALPRLGGNIASEERDGFVIDTGPDSIVASKPEGLRLCEDLGLGSRIIETTAENRRVYIVRSGELFALPEGLLFGVPTQVGAFLRTPLLSLSGKARVGAEYLAAWAGKLDATRDEDTTLGGFLRARFGGEMSDVVLEPLLGGIYSGDASELSLRATFPQWFALRQRGDSLIAAVRKQKAVRASARSSSSGGRNELARRSPFRALRGGMGLLVSTLAAKLRESPECELYTGRPVSGCLRDDRGWRIALGEGRTLRSDKLIVATQASRAATILASVDERLASELGSIAYASSIAVFLAYERRQISHALDASGYLVPMSERHNILAATFASSKWQGRAPEGKVLLRAFLTRAKDSMPEPDDTLASRARDELARQLGITGSPLFSTVVRHNETSPQPRVGHVDKVALISARAAEIPGLAVIGSAYDGIGLPDCIRLADKAAQRTTEG